MLIAKNNEEKRSKIWRLAVGVTTVLIIGIAVFFLTRMFAGNPLQGEWTGEDNGIFLAIGKDQVEVVSETMEQHGAKLRMECDVDKGKKTISFKVEEKELEKVIKEMEDDATQIELLGEVGIANTTFSYNLDNEELRLMEREYGDQLVFTRK